MTTLIAKYLAKPTAANAAKIADYRRKHMTPNGPAAMTTKTGQRDGRMPSGRRLSRTRHSARGA